MGKGGTVVAGFVDRDAVKGMRNAALFEKGGAKGFM